MLFGTLKNINRLRPLFFSLGFACITTAADAASESSDWTQWYRPVDQPVFTSEYGQNHDAILFAEHDLEYPYQMIVSHTKDKSYLWRSKTFSWSSANWELVSDNYQIHTHPEYDDGVKVDGTYYIYEGGNVFTYTGTLSEANGNWELAGTFPKNDADDVGVYFEDGVFHLFGEYGRHPSGRDGTSLSHLTSETGLGDWTLVNTKAIDPNPDGGNIYGVGDPTIVKIDGYYYIFCDEETLESPYKIVVWRANDLYGEFESLGTAIAPRSDEEDDWDNHRIQDADIVYVPELSRYVITANMMDIDGTPGGGPLENGGTRVIGVFYSNATRVVEVTNTNTTRLNEQILTRASQTMTASTLAAVAARVDSVVDGAAGGAGAVTTPTLAYQFGGRQSLRGLLESHARSMLEGGMEYERLLDGASFVLPLRATDGATDGNNKHGASALSLWGSTDNRNLDGDEDGIDWDGDVFSLHLGIDTQFNQQMMAGVALSWNESSFDYQDDIAGSSGEYQYRSTNLHPYIGWYPTDDWKLWATAGYGQGEIENDTDSAKHATNSAQLSLSGGFSRQLSVSTTKRLSDGTTSWSLKGDVSLVQVAVDEGDGFVAEDIDSQRLRLLVSGERNRKTTSGGELTPSLEIGVRSDGGDGESGTGAELGGGLRYTKPGGDLTVSGNIRTLLAASYNEWGADFSVRLSPQSGHGLSLSLHPVWGKTQSAAERLWNDGISETAGEITGGDTALRGSLNTEIGYAMAATLLGSPGLLMPYAGMTAQDGGTSRLRLGGRFAGGNGLSLNLEGAQKNTTDGASHQVLLRGEVAL